MTITRTHHKSRPSGTAIRRISLAFLGLLGPLAIASSDPSQPFKSDLFGTLCESKHGGLMITLQPGPDASCTDLNVNAEIVGDDIRIDVKSAKPAASMSCSISEAARPSTSVELPADAKTWKMHISNAVGTDTYQVASSPLKLSLFPVGTPSFTHFETGEFLRVPVHSLWLEVSFGNALGRKKLAPKEAALLKSLREVGAKSVNPTPGRYASTSNAWRSLDLSHAPVATPFPVDRFFFDYEGDLARVKEIFQRFAKFDQAHDRSPNYMSIFIGSWDGITMNSYLP